MDFHPRSIDSALQPKTTGSTTVVEQSGFVTYCSEEEHVVEIMGASVRGC